MESLKVNHRSIDHSCSPPPLSPRARKSLSILNIQHYKLHISDRLPHSVNGIISKQSPCFVNNMECTPSWYREYSQVPFNTSTQFKAPLLQNKFEDQVVEIMKSSKICSTSLHHLIKIRLKVSLQKYSSGIRRKLGNRQLYTNTIYIIRSP